VEVKGGKKGEKEKDRREKARGNGVLTGPQRTSNVNR